MLNCRSVSKLMSEAHDHQISFPRRALLHMHLAMCKVCRRVADQIEIVRKLARAAGDVETDPLFADKGALGGGLSPQVKAELKKKLSRK
jgi:hypothetical protein